MHKNLLYVKWSFYHRSALLLCFFALPCFLFAQKDTIKKLKEVTVSGSNLPKIQTITPSQQITSNDFDRYSALNVADAIRDFAGVNIKDYGGIGGLKTVSIRGFSANHTAILYDGIEINDVENGQIDLSKLNLNGIQQITLYNGQPDDILAPARSFASASIISIKTLKPSLTADKPYQILAGVKAGSWGLINPYLQWQQRINDKWSFVINSYSENANGQYKYNTNINGPYATLTRSGTAVSDQQVDGALYWTKNDSNKFSLHINYYNSDRGLPAAILNTNPTSFQRLWNKDVFLQSGYEYTWSNGLHLLLNTKLSQYFTRYRDPAFLNNAGGQDDRYTQREFYQSAALSYRILSNWEVSYATDISFSNLGAYSPDGDIQDYAFPSRFTLLNVLASNFTTGKWIFQGSLLNTDVTEQVKVGKPTPKETALSPTLMAMFKPFKNKDLRLRAFYKDIFREPTFDEQYYFSLYGSRDLKPEFAKQYDLGVTYRKNIDKFIDYISITADGYYNTIINKIVIIPGRSEAQYSIINLGKVRIEGTDISIKTQTRKMDGWRAVMAFNYTYQYAVEADLGTYYLEQIPYTPKNTLAINAGVEYNQMGLYFNQIVSSSRYFLRQSTINNYLDGYAVSDLSYVYKFSAYGYPFTFSAHINNLFNESYEIVQSFPMPGRSFICSLQIKI
jgi:vitamin B12 transporter